jgi:hypothetical protein
LLGEELSGGFYEKELQKVEQKYIGIKLFVLIKWLG